jgi:hypothetical protein
MRWPQTHYLASERHRLLYIPIEKVACSSLKAWIVARETDQETSQCEDPNRYAREHLELGSLSRRRALRLLNDRQLLRFAFVRNPWDRLVSAFLNKFVPLPLKRPAVNFFNELEQFERLGPLARCPRWLRTAADWGLARWRGNAESGKTWDDFTFEDFVTALRRMPVRRWDVHWRPQHLFFAGRMPDVIGRFEHLDDDFQFLCERLGLPSQLPSRNKTPRQPVVTECLANVPLNELRRMDCFPRYTYFYNDALRKQVAEMYRQDIELLGYAFQSDGARLPAGGKTSSAPGLNHSPQAPKRRGKVSQRPLKRPSPTVGLSAVG